MPLLSGTRLGPYEVVAPIGAGGMGEVYRARDTQLGRDVAIKVLPATLIAEPERAARFDREAQVLAALNHPNIAAIYGIEQHVCPDGTSGRALILEFVDGPTLADLIAQSPLPLDEAIAIAKQIALALEGAHDQGIVHRDLKPANVKVRPDGTVKVLDFGLAKAFESSSGARPSNVSMSPTLTAATQVGVILGTAAYMAPEQARGKSVDKRADVWAFGCVLYEMLTGRRAFGGEEVSDTLAFIITKDIDWQALPDTTPLHVRRVLHRCLEKDPNRRLRDIRDARLELDAPIEGIPDAGEAPATVTTGPSSARRQIVSAVAVVIAMLVGGLAAWILTRPARVTPAPLQRFPIDVPASAPFVGEPGAELAVSPDGATLVYVGLEGGKRLLYQRRLDQLDPVPIRGTDDAYNPFFAPDGEWIGYFTAAGTPNGRLKKVSTRGGPPLTLAETSVPSGTWTRDDRIIFTRLQDGRWALFVIPAAGGTATKLTNPDASKNEQRHGWPELLPDGKTLLFSVSSGSAAFEQSSIAVLSFDTGKYHTVVQQGYHERYVSTGHLVYVLDGNLMAVPFDATRLQTTGPPVPVVEGIRGRQSVAEAVFAVSSTGTLFYGPGGTTRSGANRLVWVDRKGHEAPIAAPPRAYYYPRISPDGSQVALDVRDQKNDIWIWDFARQTLTPLTFDPAPDMYPVWSSDGRRVFYASGRAGVTNIYVQAADGTGHADRLMEATTARAPSSVSPDGKFLVYQELGAKTNSDLWMVSLADRRATPLLQAPFRALNADVSPDGRWIAYQSDESGQNQIYVRPFPAVDSGRWQVSTAGGTRPVWARNGRELFYVTLVASNVQVMAVPVQPGAAFTAGSPTPLFSGPYVPPSSVGGRFYDVSPDGQRFLMINTPSAGATSETGAPFVAVVNWTSELPRLAPAKH